MTKFNQRRLSLTNTTEMIKYYQKKTKEDSERQETTEFDKFYGQKQQKKLIMINQKRTKLI